jgi:hypothetical protein
MDDDLIEMGEALQKSPHVTRLTFEVHNEFELEVSFLKTAIYASSVRRLDWDCHILTFIFEELANLPIPQDPCKESMIQELNLSSVELAEQLTVVYLVAFLEVHLPKLRSLSLDGQIFDYSGGIHFAEWLQKCSLVELHLRFAPAYTEIPQLIFAALHNHSTLKIFRMELFHAHSMASGCIIRTATEAIRVFQLQCFHLDISLDDSLYGDDHGFNDPVEEVDFEALLQSLALNTTLTDAYFDYENMHTDITEKIDFYAKRNKEFQKIKLNLIVGGMNKNYQCNDEKDEAFHVDHNDHLSTVGVNSGGVNWDCGHISWRQHTKILPQSIYVAPSIVISNRLSSTFHPGRKGFHPSYHR